MSGLGLDLLSGLGLGRTAKTTLDYREPGLGLDLLQRHVLRGEFFLPFLQTMSGAEHNPTRDAIG